MRTDTPLTTEQRETLERMRDGKNRLGASDMREREAICAALDTLDRLTSERDALCTEVAALKERVE